MIGLFKISGINSKLQALRMSEVNNNMFLGNYNVNSVLFKDGVTTISAESEYEPNTIMLSNISTRYNVDIEYSVSDHVNNIKYSGIVIYQNGKSEIIESRKEILR